MLTAKTETVADIHDLLALTPLAPTEILGRTERGLREATSDPEMTMKAAEEEAPIVDGLVCVYEDGRRDDRRPRTLYDNLDRPASRGGSRRL